MATLSRCQPLLGTFVEICVSGDCEMSELRHVSENAFVQVREILKTMSVHDPDSELSRLNRFALHHHQAISSPMREVLEFAQLLSQATEGLFDATVGSDLVSMGHIPHFDDAGSGTWKSVRIDDRGVSFDGPLVVDLGGVAKGYAVDKALDSCPSGIEMKVNAGGDLRMSSWQEATVLIRVPISNRTQKTSFVVHPMLSAAIATSCDFNWSRSDSPILKRNKCRSLDPRSYSVFAETCMVADALTKVVRLDQSPRTEKILRRFGALALIIDDVSSTTTMPFP